MELVGVGAHDIAYVLKACAVRCVDACVSDSDLLSHNRLVGCGVSALNDRHAIGGYDVGHGSVLAGDKDSGLSLIHISEPTRRYAISYAVFCLKKKNPILLFLPFGRAKCTIPYHFPSPPVLHVPCKLCVLDSD